MSKKKSSLILAAAAALLLLIFLLSLLVGRYPLTLGGLLAAEPDSMERRVFLNLRLPRTIIAALGGFGLGIAGYVYQTVFRNPLAAPDIIGVSSGASVGAAMGILFLSASPLAVTVSAFCGALSAVLLALGLAFAASGLARTYQRSDTASLVLAGIAVHALAQTLLMLLKITADPEKELAAIEYWIMGSLSGANLRQLPVFLGVCISCSAAIFLIHRHILMLAVDEEEARLLGVPVNRMRLAVLLLATLIVASTVSVTGLVSFIGLLAPHIARLLLQRHWLATLALSGLLGAILLCMADILARSAASGELPVSIFTSLLGVPFLLYLMLKKEKN